MCTAGGLIQGLALAVAFALGASFAAGGSWSTAPVADRCPDVRVVYQAASPDLVNQSNAPDNKYGLEDGRVVRTKSGDFVMVSAEMYADPRWVAMRLGVWRSADGYAWTRQRTLRQSSGTTDGTDPHAASWGPMLVHDEARDVWALSYVAYRSGGRNYSGWLENFEGTIYYAEANTTGDAGLEGDFGDSGDWRDTDKVLLAPDDFGKWFPCQGLQGTDSMFPYQLPNGSWAALVGTSHQEGGWRPSAAGEGKWPVSLATAPALAGPWTRYNPADPGDPADAPCLNVTWGHTENPIVSPLPGGGGGFLAVYDDLRHESVGFSRACSGDGVVWGGSSLVPVPGGARTPFGVLPMTSAEVAEHAARIAAYGTTTVPELKKQNATLAWLFYTATVGGWERFRSAVVEIGAV